jgi:hygromycin-B 4-O-kinase
MLLTPQVVEAFLIETTGAAVGDLSPITLGEWSTVYSFEKEGKAFVVRFSDYREDFAKDRIAYSYNSPGLPVPRIIQIGEAFGGHFVISEKSPGIPIDLLDSAEMQRVIPAVFDLLDALRTADISGSEGYGSWSEDRKGAHASWKQALLDIASDTPAKRIHGWKNKLSASVGLEAFSHLQQKLTSLTDSCPEERHLIHSDLLHYNLLIANNEITAVLDWGNSLYGDFLYELAWFTFWSSWHPAMAGIDFSKLSRSKSVTNRLQKSHTESS